MVFRVALVLGAILFGGITGGFAGVFLAFLVCGVVGGMIGPPERTTRPPSAKPLQEQTEARRGKRKDPTAPSEEWAGALQNLRRRG